MFSPTQNSSLTRSEYQPSPSRPIARQKNTDARRLILIVEDNADSCIMLRTLLEIWDYRVIEARDGEQAISMARTESPSLILMDVKIPVIDGVEATRRIREFASPEQLPVVFVSGHVQPGFRMVAIASGGNDYLIKPLDFKELESVLEKYIGAKNYTDDPNLRSQ